MGLKDSLNKKDSIFGVTVHSFDNNKFMFLARQHLTGQRWEHT